MEVIAHPDQHLRLCQLPAWPGGRDGLTGVSTYAESSLGFPQCQVGWKHHTQRRVSTETDFSLFEILIISGDSKAIHRLELPGFISRVQLYQRDLAMRFAVPPKQPLYF